MELFKALLGVFIDGVASCTFAFHNENLDLWSSSIYKNLSSSRIRLFWNQAKIGATTYLGACYFKLVAFNSWFVDFIQTKIIPAVLQCYNVWYAAEVKSQIYENCYSNKI